MDFKNFVPEIAVADLHGRQSAILNILRGEGLPFSLRRTRENGHWVENIVVPFLPCGRRIVLGAHYDAVSGSTGANDNASGVTVLLNLARVFLQQGVQNAEIVFFDREEDEDHGSSAYIQSTGQENIDIMINLDMCGFGDRIFSVSKGNRGNRRLGTLFSDEMLEKHAVGVIERLPFRFGDDDTFDSFGIPNIAVTAMPGEELLFTAAFIEKLCRGESASLEEVQRYRSLSYSQTMHNAPLDRVDTVSPDMMYRVASWLCEGLQCVL